MTVIMDRVSQVLTVPVDAVSYDNGAPFVYLYEDGKSGEDRDRSRYL